MTIYLRINNAPELSTQQGRQQVVNQAGENTGMIECPLKMAGIAIERCWMYQAELGCGLTCKAKAKRTEIGAVRKAKRERVEYGEVHARKKEKGQQP